MIYPTAAPALALWTAHDATFDDLRVERDAIAAWFTEDERLWRLTFLAFLADTADRNPPHLERGETYSPGTPPARHWLTRLIGTP